MLPVARKSSDSVSIRSGRSPCWPLRGTETAHYKILFFLLPALLARLVRAWYNVAVKQTESTLRAIRDRIAAAMGTLEETASDPARKENHRRLREAASELHRCADEVQNVMMRIKPRAS